MLLALRYPAMLENRDGTIVVSFRDFPEALTEGHDRESALSNGVDCLDAALHFRMKDQKPMPLPSPETPGEVGVIPTAETSMRVALYQAYRASGLSLAEFARRAGMNQARVQEITCTYKPFDMRKVADALRRLGRPVALAVDAA